MMPLGLVQQGVPLISCLHKRLGYTQEVGLLIIPIMMPLGLVRKSGGCRWGKGQVAKLGMKLDSPTFLAIIQGK